MSSSSAEYDFVVSAQPHAWFLTADNLHEQALFIYSKKSKGRLTLRTSNRSDKIWDIADKTSFLLCGFALENLIKAFLIYENPEYIADGRLSRKILSHNLVKIRSDSKLIPLKTKYSDLLDIFSEGIETWARYPCATTSARTFQQPEFSTELWEKYNYLVSAYSKKLIKLLEKDWNGPHGFQARYEIQGSFFDSIK